MALLASVAFFPRIIDFQRRNSTVGPNEGSVHFISFGGDRYSMELARGEALGFQPAVYIQPTRERTPWQPEEYHVKLRMEDDDEFEVLEWNPEERFFGISRLRIHPRSDVRFVIEINRGETTVWSGRRWSFQLGGGHAH